MAKVCKNMKELEKELMNLINESLLDDVAPVVKNAMLYHIEKDVYSPEVYTPETYSRRGKNGGFADPKNIIISPEYDGCVSVSNQTLGREFYYQGGEPIRSDNANKPIAEIIETGDGYDYWKHSFPRPFMKNTVEHLKEEHLIEKVLKDSLKMKGLEVK